MTKGIISLGSQGKITEHIYKNLKSENYTEEAFEIHPFMVFCESPFKALEYACNNFYGVYVDETYFESINEEAHKVNYKDLFNPFRNLNEVYAHKEAVWIIVDSTKRRERQLFWEISRRLRILNKNISLDVILELQNQVEEDQLNNNIKEWLQATLHKSVMENLYL